MALNVQVSCVPRRSGKPEHVNPAVVQVLADPVPRFHQGGSQEPDVDHVTLRIKLNVSPDLGRLPQEVESAIFRIVQECLTNIHRHSGRMSGELNNF